jgi:hypothetical protein
MIERANDPQASRMSYRPAQAEGKGYGERNFSRGGHAWPFLSHYAVRPAPQDAPKTVRSDSGS